MTRRACNGALASTLKVNVVLVRDVEDVIAFVRFHCPDQVSFGVLEMNTYSKGRFKVTNGVRQEDGQQHTLFRIQVYRSHRAGGLFANPMITETAHCDSCMRFLTCASVKASSLHHPVPAYEGVC